MEKKPKGKTVIGPPLPLPISRAIRAGDFVFTSGQCPFDGDSYVVEPGINIVEGGIEKQTRVVLQRIEQTLGKAGCTLYDVVQATVWLQDSRDFARFNTVYAEFFPKDPPVRVVIRADLIIDVKVEIQVVAYKPQ